MQNIKLLDCTLRDGGYINDWKFGHDNMVSIFERVVDSGVDIIEVGFIDQRRIYDFDRSIMPDTQCVKKIYGNLERKETMVVGMIDYGTCDLEYIEPANDSYLDGIRVIFKKHLRKEALQYCAELKKLGYKVFVQLVSVTSYSDEELMDLIRLANEVEPYAVSMVDTYGLMHQNNLNHSFDFLDRFLCPQIALGYHGHNNFQMAYANCIAFLARDTERRLIVDATLYGMGKSAGNAPIELVAMHMNNVFQTHYHISQLLEAIDSSVMQFYQSSTWGYNMFFYMAASNDCHPNYVEYLLNKKTLSVRSVNELLGKLQGERKLLYDREYIEKLYAQYQNNEVNDKEDRQKLEPILKERKIVMIGPGATMKTDSEKVRAYIQEKGACVIAINHIPEKIQPDIVFLSNSKRYLRLATTLSQKKKILNEPPIRLLATSNVTAMTEGTFDFVLNFSTLIDPDAEFIDSSLIMMLKALISFGIDSVALAGFDGYSRQRDNYFDNAMEYDFVKEKEEYLNCYTTDFLNCNKEKIKVTFITDSEYQVRYLG